MEYAGTVIGGVIGGVNAEASGGDKSDIIAGVVEGALLGLASTSIAIWAAPAMVGLIVTGGGAAGIVTECVAGFSLGTVAGAGIDAGLGAAIPFPGLSETEKYILWAEGSTLIGYGDAVYSAYHRE